MTSLDWHAHATAASMEMQAATCQALISLLAASGLRLGEALALSGHDVDLDTGVATVRSV